MKKNKGWIIVGVIILLLLIGAAILAARANPVTPVAPTPNPNPATPQSQPNILNTLSGLFKKWFGKDPVEPYVQVEPIDEDGCDANGYNKIGIKCFGAF